MELKYLIGIGGYLALMLFIGYWVKNKISTAEDYLVGGRSFNTLYNTATVTSIPTARSCLRPLNWTKVCWVFCSAIPIALKLITIPLQA